MVDESRMIGIISFTNLNLGIALHDAGINIIMIGTSIFDITFTTAIDVTEVSTALAFCTNGTTRDIDIRIKLYKSTLATTKDRTLDLGATIDIHISLAG